METRAQIGDKVHVYNRLAYNRRGRVVAIGRHAGCIVVELVDGGKVDVPAVDCDVIKDNGEVKAS